MRKNCFCICLAFVLFCSVGVVFAGINTTESTLNVGGEDTYVSTPTVVYVSAPISGVISCETAKNIEQVVGKDAYFTRISSRQNILDFPKNTHLFNTTKYALWADDWVFPDQILLWKRAGYIGVAYSDKVQCLDNKNCESYFLRDIDFLSANFSDGRILLLDASLDKPTPYFSPAPPTKKQSLQKWGEVAADRGIDVVVLYDSSAKEASIKQTPKQKYIVTLPDSFSQDARLVKITFQGTTVSVDLVQ